MPVMKTVNGHPGGSAVDSQQAVLDRVSMPVMMAGSHYAVRDCVSKPDMNIVNGHPPAVAIAPVSGTRQSRARRSKADRKRAEWSERARRKSQGTASFARDSQASLQIARLQRSELSWEPANTQVFNGHRYFPTTSHPVAN
jgi:hypothetical protein